MGKHYLRLDSPYAWRFSKLTRKIHAEIGLSAVQTSEPTSKTRGNTLLVLLLCNVMYRIVYRIVTTVSGYVSFRGKMYRCRPTHDTSV